VTWVLRFLCLFLGRMHNSELCGNFFPYFDLREVLSGKQSLSQSHAAAAAASGDCLIDCKRVKDRQCEEQLLVHWEDSLARSS
jgi:hypothetical protein